MPEEQEAREMIGSLTRLAGIRPSAEGLERAVQVYQSFGHGPVAALRSADVQEFEPVTIYRPFKPEKQP
jgi:hypothetical protein